MGDTAMNVPVKARTHELKQLQEMLPQVRDGLVRGDMDDAAEEVWRIYDEHVSGVEATYPEDDFAAWVSMPAEDWRLTIRYLNRARRDESPLRVQWLQNKLVDRVEARLEEME